MSIRVLLHLTLPSFLSFKKKANTTLEIFMRSLCSCGATCKKPPCDKCKPKANSKRSDHYDRQWRVLSERFRAHNPLCQDCEKQGRVEPATEVHHIIPIEQSPSQRLDQSNLVALCTGCHKSRHRRLKLGYAQDDFSV